MKINWKVRLKSKAFWVAVIPAVILLIQAVTAIFGCSIDLTVIQDRLLSVVNAVFVLLSVLGIVVDNTTAGLSDSEQALTYEEPRRDYIEEAELESDLAGENEEVTIEEGIETTE
ncbi:phage holin [Hominibacterium faecale]|uniref:phage holin n=1 Tax=Hominibacterium faecale TaxID=2839743 RepID=UPI0022B2A7CC|nr:phage holin [Hominibacterium faecale]